MAHTIELGLDTFGDATVDAQGKKLSQAQAIRDVITQGERADQLGLDFFGVGEHHRSDFSVSAPEVVLAAIAARTKRIHLGSAVTVLSTDDPVRVFQRFSTLNAISSGRAEVIVGRGSFTESYPLFVYALAQYEQLFEEKLELFSDLLTGGPVTRSGRTRAVLKDQTVHPLIERGTLRTWVGVGGSPESVIRAARYGFPLTLAIIGGSPQRFRSYVDLYHQALDRFGHEPQPVAVHSPGHVAATDQQAKDELWPHYERMMNRIGAERGWPRRGRADFEQDVALGALCVGSPETVAAKIAGPVKALGLSRFDLKYSHGTLPHELMITSLELIGTKVAPRVREAAAALKAAS